MELFNEYNTDGYSADELAALNSEWVEIVASKNLEEYTDEYNIEAKRFSDEVSSR